MAKSFGSIPAPIRPKQTAKAIVSGDELVLEFQSLDIPTSQLAIDFAYKQIVKYIKPEDRRLFVPGKDEPEVVDFPATHETGAIRFTEQALIELSNMFFMQTSMEGDDEWLPFNEFVYMRTTCPDMYTECQRAIVALLQPENIEGNPSGVDGSESSALASTNH
jgi:hypothetical protein